VSDSATLIKAIENFFYKINQNEKLLESTKRIMDFHLYNPNSNLRNDQIYELFQRRYLKSQYANSSTHFADSVRLSIVMKNQIGKKASDFSYLTPENSLKRMYDIKSEKLMLFFYNPGCHSCEATLKDFKESIMVNKLIKDKRLKVLAIFPDNNKEDWMNTLSEIPDYWIKGYDSEREIEDTPLYDLKAIPCIYLLDENKTVLVKDGSLRSIEKALYTDSRKNKATIITRILLTLINIKSIGFSIINNTLQLRFS
jgi:AhpC/TSA family.